MRQSEEYDPCRSMPIDPNRMSLDPENRAIYERYDQAIAPAQCVIEAVEGADYFVDESGGMDPDTPVFQPSGIWQAWSGVASSGVASSGVASSGVASSGVARSGVALIDSTAALLLIPLAELVEQLTKVGRHFGLPLITDLETIETETDPKRTGAILAAAAERMEAGFADGAIMAEERREAIQYWSRILRIQSALWPHADLTPTGEWLVRPLTSAQILDIGARFKDMNPFAIAHRILQDWLQAAERDPLHASDYAPHIDKAAEVLIGNVRDPRVHPDWLELALDYRLAHLFAANQSRSILPLLAFVEAGLQARPYRSQELCRALRGTLREIQAEGFTPHTPGFVRTKLSCCNGLNLRPQPFPNPLMPHEHRPASLVAREPLSQTAEAAIRGMLDPQDLRALEGPDGRITRSRIEREIPPGLLSAWERFERANPGFSSDAQAVALVQLASGFRNFDGTDFRASGDHATFQAALDSARHTLRPAAPLSAEPAAIHVGHEGTRVDSKGAPHVK